MMNQFKRRIFGYDRKQVDQFVFELKKDYENTLASQRERILNQEDENRRMKKEIAELNEKIGKYIEQEKYVTRALVLAEQKASALEEECRAEASSLLEDSRRKAAAMLEESMKKSSAMLEESQQKCRKEWNDICIERSKWQNRFRSCRSELISLEQTVLGIMEKFRDDINYYTAKEASEALLMDDEAAAARDDNN